MTIDNAAILFTDIVGTERGPASGVGHEGCPTSA
jgi:hypothetical protein